MTDRFEIDPENGWVDTVIENAARAMYEAEWGSWDETLESVRSIYRNRASAVAAAGLLRTEPAVHPADVPQPGDRVRVTWRRAGNTRESVVDEHGYYEGKGAVLMYPDTVTVEVIEPAPAREDKPEFADRLAEASRAAAEATFGVRPADTGKEAGRG